MTTFRFEVKDKGRVVLPAGLRAACDFSTGTELVARPLGPGRFVVETDAVILERIWAGRPEMVTDAVDELAKWRSAVGTDRWQALSSETADDGHSEERSAAALRALGL